MSIQQHSLAVVIPAYNAAGTIQSVLRDIPPYADWIIVVDDGSTDHTADIAAKIADPRMVVLCHENNAGVGGAMVTGYRKALALGAQLIAKIDADGQMDPSYLSRFAGAALIHKCDYVKANRFGHIDHLPSMPPLRLAGNLILTFLTKCASGYWNVFDPQNGYVMITRQMLRRIDLDRIDGGYFFENSMLINLNILRARIGEIYLPARYGNEISSMKLGKIIRTFPRKLLSGFMYRIYQKYVFRSLSPVALLLVFGLAAIAWGCLWGGMAWYHSCTSGVPATTGTVMIALLPFLLGWTAILQSILLDVQDAGTSLLFDHDDESLGPP